MIGGRRATAVLVVVLMAVMVTGCEQTPRPAPSATALPQGVSASLIQLRSDVASRQAQVQVRNDSDELLSISFVRVRDARFRGSAWRLSDRTTQIAPGRTVDIPVQLPSMACGPPAVLPLSSAAPSSTVTPPASPMPTSSPSPTVSHPPSPSPSQTKAASPTATIHYEFGASSAVAVLALPEPVPFVHVMHARECLARHLQDSASVTVSSFTPSPPGQPADLTLEIAPTGHAPARIIGIRPTNLLGFAHEGGAAADVHPIGFDILAVPAEPTLLHLPLVPARCDPHAVMEDKRGTVFTLDVEVAGVPGEIQLAASDDMRGELLAWVGAWCRFGT